MSDRSEYSDEYEHVHLWQGAVLRAAKGARGQAMLTDLVEALDELPVHELAAGVFDDRDGCCAFGALARHRGVTLDDLDPEAEGLRDDVATRFNIAPSLAADIMARNDSHGDLFGGGGETGAARWARIRAWAVSKLADT